MILQMSVNYIIKSIENNKIVFISDRFLTGNLLLNYIGNIHYETLQI